MTKTAKDFKGVDIREVWDFRLSTACPAIYNSRETWQVEITSNISRDYDPEKPDTLTAPLEVHDTGIPVDRDNLADPAAIAACYEWLYSVRDNYARDNIEELKPVVAEINRKNIEAAELQSKLVALQAEGK